MRIRGREEVPEVNKKITLYNEKTYQDKRKVNRNRTHLNKFW